MLSLPQTCPGYKRELGSPRDGVDLYVLGFSLIHPPCVASFHPDSKGVKVPPLGRSGQLVSSWPMACGFSLLSR